PRPSAQPRHGRALCIGRYVRRSIVLPAAQRGADQQSQPLIETFMNRLSSRHGKRRTAFRIAVRHCATMFTHPRRPHVSREMIAFEYGGDLWVVPRAGGNARRLTSTPSAESDPRFSPDGSMI